ncbi:MAG TPA: ABC transporter permease [Longimicrobiales bacterium]
MHDIRYAWRTLRRSPVFAATAILTLALGIGANSALFGLLNALLFRPPTGIPESDRLVRVENAGRFEEVSYPDYLEIRDAARRFAGIAAYTSAGMALASGGEPIRVTGQLVSGNYFDVLGVRPVLGRGFLAGEDRTRGTHPVAVIGYDLWVRRFAADPTVVGRTVTLNGYGFTVVGVAPEGFMGTEIEEPAEVWVPTMMRARAMPAASDLLTNRRFGRFHLIGRLADGVPLEQAEAALGVISRRLDPAEPDRFEPLRLTATPLTGWIPLRGLGSTLPMLAFAGVITGLVLLIACANVANLLLARAVARRHEIGVRLALGAGRRRLIRQLVTESVLLALLGGGLGLVGSFWLADAFRARFRMVLAPLDVSPDAHTLAFTFALALGTGVLFGLVPAWRASRTDLRPALAGDGASRFRRSRLQGALVVAQMALSLTLLFAAGLFLRRLDTVAETDVGFEVDDVVVLTLDLESQGYTPAAGEAFQRALRERAAGLPGVRAAAVASGAPLVGGRTLHWLSAAEGASTPAGTTAGAAPVVAMGVSPGFFRTLGIPVLRGRGFTDRDTRDAPRVAVISQQLARRQWPDRDPIGRVFYFGPSRDTPIRVVGVVPDVATSLSDPQMAVFLPRSQHFQMAESYLIARVAGDPSTIIEPLRDAVHAIDPDVPVYAVRTMAQVVEESVDIYRDLALVITGFGALALALAALGLYGVMAFTAASRAREVGIRIALGADAGAVLGLFIRDGLRLTAIGAALGVALALALGRLIGSIVAGVRPVDPLAFAGVVAVLAGAALIASWLPARRAARVDPMAALRSE